MDLQYDDILEMLEILYDDIIDKVFLLMIMIMILLLLIAHRLMIELGGILLVIVQI